jgi:ketosteroid isomerase-like protein
MSSSTELIRAARERFNIAIEYKDAEAIRALLAPEYHIVTGRSVQTHGVEDATARWAEVFRTDPVATYTRAPREITVNEDWGIAEELGNWHGRFTTDGELVQASGVYAAKWHCKENGEWVLLVEVFTALTCEGPCQPPDPIT